MKIVLKYPKKFSSNMDLETFEEDMKNIVTETANMKVKTKYGDQI